MALDRKQIVAAAVELLDEAGLDGVTVRALARRLGVQSPTLYWHIRNKAELITALAEAILGEQLSMLRPPEEHESWQEWLIGAAQLLRRAMLAHPDGARVVSTAQLSQAMAGFSELTIRALVERAVPLRQARLTVLVVERFTTGHVLEEQAPQPDPDSVRGFDLDEFTKRYPTVVAGITEYFTPGRTVDDLFRDGLDVILG